MYDVYFTQNSQIYFLPFPRWTGPSPWRKTAFKHATEKFPTRTRRARRRPCWISTQRWLSRPLWTTTVGPFPLVPGLSWLTATRHTSSRTHPHCTPPPLYPTHTTSTLAWCPHWCETWKLASFRNHHTCLLVSYLCGSVHMYFYIGCVYFHFILFEKKVFVAIHLLRP